MKKLIVVIITMIVFFVGWEITANNFSILKFFVSTPTDAFRFALSHKQNIFDSTLITSIEALIGFCIAVIFSFFIMFFCLLHPQILKIILPVFITSQVLPIITLSPFFIILFGMGLLSKIAMVVLMCFFPIFINFSAGVTSVPQTTHDLLYIYNSGKIFKIFKVIIPLSTPYIFTGLKVSTTMAIMGAIVAEFVGAKDGLGKNLYLAPKNANPELMICSIVLTTLLGWCLFKIVEITEKKVGYWYYKIKG